MKRFALAMLLAVLAFCPIAEAQVSTPPNEGNIVAFYDEAYFGTINMTDLTTSGSDWLPPFRCFSGNQWGTWLVIEFVFTGVTASGTASAEFRYTKSLASDADFSVAPVTLQATGTTPNTVYMENDASDFTPASSRTLIDNTDAPTTEAHWFMIKMRETIDLTSVAFLPPVLIFGFDSSTGNGWTAGTLSCRVWVLK